jgi:hypothetical protein
VTTARRAARESLPRVLATALLIAASACADGFRALGNPAAAEAKATLLLGALATRYLPVERDARYDTARIKLAKAALVPSRVWDDSAVWTARPGPATRVLNIQGGLVGGHYRLEARPALGPATAPGESRHSIALERLGESVFRWDTQVGFAIGAVTGPEVGAVFGALLGAGEGKSATDLRADYRAAFPRAAAAWGRGFSVDSLDLSPGGGPGLTSVTLTIAFHPERLQPTYPAFSQYLDRYLKPAKYHFVLADRSGATLFDIVGRDRAMTLRYRVARGIGLVSLSGVPRPLADTLQLRADASLKVKLFTVGFHNLATDFVITRTAHERAWSIVAQHEPEWDLPLVTERLIRSSLRRPFEGPGALLKINVRDTAGGQTMIARRVRLDVQESSIMRFLGGLGAHMFGDISDKVELEEYRFLQEGFAALVADVRALGGRARD